MAPVYLPGSFIEYGLQPELDCEIGLLRKIGEIIGDLLAYAVGARRNSDTAHIRQHHSFVYHRAYLPERAVGIGIRLEIRDIFSLAPLVLHGRSALVILLGDAPLRIAGVSPAPGRAVYTSASALCTIDIRTGKARAERYPYDLAAEFFPEHTVLGIISLAAADKSERIIILRRFFLHDTAPSISFAFCLILYYTISFVEFQ